MGKLIDADKISFNDIPMDMGGYVFIEDILQKIEDLPTVDAVPVVRCKDCIHWCATVTHSTMCDKYEPDAFCSHGERRKL